MADAPAPQDRPLLDRWILSELHSLIKTVDDALERFDTALAGRALTTFIDDLSNWYVRRSRRRFWAGAGTPEGAAAFATLFECLETLTLLMAPIVPFITDHVWQALRRPDAPESVHLASWPKADESLIDPALSEQMALVRRLVELGRAARVDSGQRVRQPLARALVGAPGFAELPEQLRAQIAEELNVVQLDPLSVVGGDLVDYSVKPNFRALGKRFGKTTPRVAQAIREADAKTLVERLRADNAATVDVDGEQVVLSADEVVVTEQPREGWTVASEAGETVALDLELTPELRRAGVAREVIRLVQDARKSSGLNISDRIHLWWSATDEMTAQAMAEHAEAISSEVLAVSFTEGTGDADAYEVVSEEFGITLRLRKA